MTRGTFPTCSSLEPVAKLPHLSGEFLGLSTWVPIFVLFLCFSILQALFAIDDLIVIWGQLEKQKEVLLPAVAYKSY